MPDLFFDQAFLPSGWARHVLVTVDGDGSILSVDEESERGSATHVRGITVPGVPNVHGHAFQRALAGLAERGSARGDSFWSWRTRMYEFLERLDPDDVQAIAAQLHVELLRHGYTASTEFHYLRNDPAGGTYADPVEMARRILAAAAETGMSVTLLPTLYRSADFGGVDIAPPQRRFSVGVEDLLGDIAVLAASIEGGGARVGLALHSLRAVPPDALEEAVTACRELDPTMPIHIHVAEQRREVDGCLAWSGRRPVSWLLDHAPVDGRWCLIHATHVDDAELRGISAAGAVVGLCPTTEANLGDGIFPLARYRALDGRWAVGSDSHVSVSPVADLRLLEYGQRLTAERRNVAAGDEDRSTGRVLLESAWLGGAAASGRPLGRIEPGSRADLVVLDADHPGLAGRHADALLDSWIFSGEDTPIRHVFVSGRQVIRDGRHDRQAEIAARYRETVSRLSRGA